MPDVTTRFHTVELPDGPLELSWAAVTDVGRRRETNQDAVLAQYPLFIIADGMGGHIGGEIASSRTVARMQSVAGSAKITPREIEKAIKLAVRDIASHPGSTDDGTGTTLTGVYLDVSGLVPHWVTLNIGDSRVYLLRDGRIAQVTTDHSVVQELIAAGRLSPEEAESHPYGNVITRAVGPSDHVKPDYVRLDVVEGDRFVICSDGLTKELTDYGIQHFLGEHPDAADAVEAMLDAALENGGRDNVSIIVLNVGSPESLVDDERDADAPREDESDADESDADDADESDADDSDADEAGAADGADEAGDAEDRSA